MRPLCFIARHGLALALIVLLHASSAIRSPTDGAGWISGRITYDFVPVRGDAAGGALLDYAATQVKPVRHVTVEAIDATGRVRGRAVTGEDGRYRLQAPAATQLHLRIKSEINNRTAQGVSWRYAVRDNTSAGFAHGGDAAALYMLRSKTFSSADHAQVVHVHAGSGWTGTRYGAARAAAPFAILDQIDTAASVLASAYPGGELPPLNVFWSARNRPSVGNPAVGEIGEAHYQPSGAAPGLYLSGREDVDTDEYDRSVLLHEYGHYVISTLSRIDILGGTHNIGAVLEPGFALSEAWANAFSSMVRGSVEHQDTMGVGQREGWSSSLVTLSPDMARGWYSEVALGYVLHQLYGAVGLRPLLDTWTAQRQGSPAWSSIYAFATPLRARLDSAGQQRLDQLLQDIGVINAAQLDVWGSREHHLDPALLSTPSDASAVRALLFPLNPELSARAQPLCFSTRFGRDNKQGNARFGHFVAARPGRWRLRLTPTQRAAWPLRRQILVSLRTENGDVYEAFALARRPGRFELDIRQAGIYNVLLELKPNGPDIARPVCFAVRVSR
ncbi:hypothetical protein [Amantichitinum ursilacus]|uniref:Uncharacterized protein n=1 Tax=Amantichitinum ursilacus TaxID=857265 RepID=A0A0N0XHR5_9NEIS|nr:hypothetical protein [Amantichitinum ursilacus]KPC49319.1 hypothetical protein WG78_20530 [Amantichitinum ursilacus]